jgi:hypothetical protein
MRLMPNNCAVRIYSKGREALGRCWHPLQNGRCPVHGDVSGVQFRFRQTGALTDDFELDAHRKRVAPLSQSQVEYGSNAWVERFRLANPRAEIVAFRGKAPLIKIKPSGGVDPRIFVVTGGTPERPELEEYR